MREGRAESVETNQRAWKSHRARIGMEKDLERKLVIAPKSLRPLRQPAALRAKLFERAGKPDASPPLRLGLVSRAVRGSSPAVSTPREARKADAIALDPAMTVREAFAAIASACIAHILANVHCAHDGRDPEGVHQLRVGIRRLRAAFAVFGDAVPVADRNRLAGGLRWMQQELGAAREWDVFIDSTLRIVATRLNRGRSFEALERIAEQQRARAYERARAAFEDRRYADLVLRLEAGLVAGRARRPRMARGNGVPATSVPNSAIRGFASEVLRARHAKACKLGDRMRKLEDEQIHELRIRIKKLRYATEFFRAIYPEKSVKRYVAALKALQDMLGTAHDALVAEDLIPQLESGGGADIGRAVGQLQGWCAAELRSDRKQLVRLWQEFARLKPFWKPA